MAGPLYLHVHSLPYACEMAACPVPGSSSESTDSLWRMALLNSCSELILQVTVMRECTDIYRTLYRRFLSYISALAIYISYSLQEPLHGQEHPWPCTGHPKMELLPWGCWFTWAHSG